MEMKPFRPSAIVLALMGTLVVLALLAVHSVIPIPETVLTAGVVAYLMILGNAAMKLCEDAAPAEDAEITIARMNMEHSIALAEIEAANKGAPPSVPVDALAYLQPYPYDFDDDDDDAADVAS